MNLQYKDTSLATRYLQAFLQNEEDSTLRASGIYDEYTHDALVTYMELPEVQESNYVYNQLIIKYPKIPDYFRIERTINTINLECKVIDDVMIAYVNLLRVDIYEFVNSMGWSITKFVSFEDNSEVIRIEITKSTRKNIIPKSAIAMINQNIQSFKDNVGFVNGSIGKSLSNCICIIPCLPNHTYTIFVDALTCKTATSNMPATGIFDEITSIKGIKTLTLEDPTTEYTPSMCYQLKSTDATDQSILIETAIVVDPDSGTESYSNIWVLDITNYPQTEFIKYTDTSKYSMFTESWSIHSKFFDYLYGSSICKYSDDQNISYVQEMLNKLYPGYIMKVTGLWTDRMTTLVREYQKRNGIIFSIGCVDTETESLMLKDIEDRKEYGGIV